jgi:uncharacterized SAM-binding protein YcdF (DUF218 family)
VFFLLAFAGLFQSWRDYRGRRPILLAIGIAGLFLSCWPPVDWLFSRGLEGSYDIPLMPTGDAQAIVVLGSHVEPPSEHVPVYLPDSSVDGRCRHAAWLYRNWRSVPVIVSGGSHQGKRSVASTMAELMKSAGVPADQIWAEETSRNTYENARFSTLLLRQKGISKIALVVEADSMLRAELCFRKQGIAVVPAPFRQRSLDGGIHEVIPSWSALRRNERSLHEYGGLVWYMIRGWI